MIPASKYEEIKIGTWVGTFGGWDTYPCIAIDYDKDKGLKVCEALSKDLAERIRWTKLVEVIYNEKENKLLTKKLRNSEIKDKEKWLEYIERGIVKKEIDPLLDPYNEEDWDD